MKPASVGFQCPDCVKEGNARMLPIKAAYGGRAHRVPYVTYTLIGINVVMLLLTIGSASDLFSGNSSGRLFSDLALVPTRVGVSRGGVVHTVNGVAQGEYYRLLTSTFLHFGLIHLGLNMYCLYLIGPALEQAFGQLRYITLYLLSGLSGAALSYAIGPQYEIAAGASGAVFGLFGGLYVLQRKRNLDISSITSTIGLNLVFSFLVPGIDWRGHVGGLIGGALLSYAIVHAPDSKERTLYQAGAAVLLALVIVLAVVARTHDLSGGMLPS